MNSHTLRSSKILSFEVIRSILTQNRPINSLHTYRHTIAFQLLILLQPIWSRRLHCLQIFAMDECPLCHAQYCLIAILPIKCLHVIDRLWFCPQLKAKSRDISISFLLVKNSLDDAIYIRQKLYKMSLI